MQPALTRILAFAALGTCIACASDLQTGASFDPLTRFPASAVFAWDERTISEPKDPRVKALDLDPAIREAAAAELAARGYRLGARDAAAFRASYQLGVNTFIGAEESFSMGSLSLQLTEVATGRRVWVGFARAEIHVAATPEERRTRLRAAFAEMLADFPPNQPDS